MKHIVILLFYWLILPCLLQRKNRHTLAKAAKRMIAGLTNPQKTYWLKAW